MSDESSLGTPQVKQETPSWTSTIQAVVQAGLLQMHTCMPGEVQSYDPIFGTVDVQPSLKRKYVKDNEVVNLPIINSVPIAWQRANDAAITLPIKKGDTVLLVFSQRSIERWKTSGGVVEVGDPRHHDLSDAYAIPGVYPKSKPLIGVDPDNLVIRHGLASKVTVKKDEIEVAVGAAKFKALNAGKFSMGNGIVELLTLFKENLATQKKRDEAIIALTVGTGVGPSGTPINTPDFLSTLAETTATEEKLGTISV